MIELLACYAAITLVVGCFAAYSVGKAGEVEDLYLAGLYALFWPLATPMGTAYLLGRRNR